MSGFRNQDMELCVEYRKMGDFCLAEHNFTEAKNHYKASLDIAEELLNKAPDDQVWQRNLSLSAEKMGDAFAAEGAVGEALKEFKRSLYLRELLVEKNPDDARAMRDLWIAYWRVSDIMEQAGSMDAVVYWHKTYSILNDMKRKSMILSADDEKYFNHLRELFGTE